MWALDSDRRTFLRATAAALLAGRLDVFRSYPRPLKDVSGLATANELASLAGATAWINSRPLTAASLTGKIVLAQFGTFTCINWLRTLPYIRAWADRYKPSGLVVIGIHTPEFPFEKDSDNVRHAMAAMNVSYPIAVDSDYAIWRGFNNQYWPALYLFDGHGTARHTQFGEGGYAESERAIQQLLDEAGARNVGDQLTPVEGRGIEAAADWADSRAPENYVGFERTQNFASPGGIVADQPHNYTMPRTLTPNQWALLGDWTVHSGSITLNEPNGRIAYGFHSRDLNLVVGPPRSARPIRFIVTLDGRLPASAHGGDVDEQGHGTAADQRLYQLVRQPQPIVDRVFEIEFLDRGVEGFAFTFG